MTAGTPGGPDDGRSLVAILDNLEREGHGERIDVGDGGSLRWAACGHEASPEDTEVLRAARVEGASDPADMSIVLAARCPTCGSTGSAVLRYGPDAGPDEADALARLDTGAFRDRTVD